VIDSSAHFSVREAAIALHHSQASPFDGLPAELKRAFLAAGHLTRVNPPWAGGPLERDIFVDNGP